MTLRRFTAEGQPTNTSLTVANSTPGSGDQLTTVSKVAAGTAVFSDAQAMHGTKSILVTAAAAADTVTMGYGGMATSSLPLEFYIRPFTLPTLATTTIGQLRAGGPAANALISLSGKLTITDAAGAVIKTFANTLAVNTWYRVALRCAPGTSTTNGTIAAAYYLGDSATPAETAYSSSTVNAGIGGANSATDGRWGKLTTVGDLTAYFDSAAVNDGLTTFIGPVGGNAPPTATNTTAASWTQNATVPFTGTASDADDTITSTTWSITAYPPTLGAAPPITNPTSLTTATFPAVAAGNYTTRLTVVSGGNTVTADKVITVTEATGGAALGARVWTATGWK